MKKHVSITDGPIIRPLLYFFFPILFGTFFQQLYNTVDALVVGNILGKEALAAVGGTTAVYTNIFVGFFVGLSSGSAVLIAQYYGSRDIDGIRKTVHSSIAISIILGVGLSLFGILSARTCLSLLGVPPEILELATSYTRIFFLGLTFLLIYNMGCAILRAIGDSKRPLYYLIISCIVNIILDVYFVAFLHMGIEGAAYATIIAEGVAAALVMLSLMVSDSAIKLYIKDIKLDIETAKNIVRIGLPAGIQSILYSISNLIISTRINGLGVDTIAADTAYAKIDSVYWMINQALGISITTFVGQNFGARKFDRIKKGINRWLLLGIGVAMTSSTIFLVFAPNFLAIFNQDPNVIAIGTKILFLLAPFWCTYVPVEILAGALRGMGDANIPTIITALGIVVIRFIWLMMFESYSLERIMVIYPITWIITGTAFLVYYYSGLYKKSIKKF